MGKKYIRNGWFVVIKGPLSKCEYDHKQGKKSRLRRLGLFTLDPQEGWLSQCFFPLVVHGDGQGSLQIRISKSGA